jgi:aryl carrier-like protein
VLDRQRGLAPLGAIGELYVGGDGVARGYCNLPELTAERFLRDPFSVYPEARMYRTGDLVRWRDDGQLDYLGRIDRQVKVRGFRVELEEIEAALGSHPAVLDAAVTVVTSGEEKTLHAFVSLVPGGRADRETIRGHLIATLPAYMRPHRIAVLDTLPLLSSGKVDRVALAALAETQLEAPAVRRGTPPTREVTVEARIRRMWQSVVRTPDALEVDENFFDAGGDSLMLMKLHASMQHEFGIELSIVDLFNETTIRKQARLIEALLTT